MSRQKCFLVFGILLVGLASVPVVTVVVLVTSSLDLAAEEPTSEGKDVTVHDWGDGFPRESGRPEQLNYDGNAAK